jgi:predicted dehydrogenase
MRRLGRPVEGKIRAAIVGFGHGGAVFHAPLLASIPDYAIAAIVTADAGRRERAARDYPMASIVASADELWTRADDLDLVVVASPNRSHVPHAIAALDAGLHVVVDKPLATTGADVRRLIAEARRRDRLLTVFHNRRWDGDFLTVRRLLAEGALGDVWRFESRFERWRPTPRDGWRESGDPAEGGGLLFDLGSHLIDQALVLFGAVADAYAEIDRRRAGVDVDDDTFVALRHTSGVRSHLWMSSAAALPGPRMRVLGSRGAYTKYGMDVQEDALRAGARPNHPGFGDDAPERYGSFGAGDAVDPVVTERGRYQDFYVELARSLRDGTAPPVDPEDAVKVLDVIDGIRARRR